MSETNSADAAWLRNLREMWRPYMDGDVPFLLRQLDAALARAERAEAQVAALATAIAMALTHTDELKTAWERGVISEHDGQGGLRSNRNAEVRRALQAALDATQEVRRDG